MKPINLEKTRLYRERHLFDRTPVTAELALTDFCDFACTYCRFERGESFIDAPMAERIVARLREWRVRGVVLTGGGEPQLNPDFEKICAILTDAGLPYGVNSNMSEYKDMNPAWLKVSIHAKTDAHCMANVERFRREHPCSTLGLQLIVQGADQVAKFYDEYGRTKCDYISLRPLEDTKPYYGVDDHRAIVKEIDRLVEMDPRVSKHYKWDYLWRRYPRCVANWSTIFIDAKGLVPYCCHKPNEIVGRFDEQDILERREAFDSRARCEVPCRHSGNNVAFEQFEIDGAPENGEFL